MQNLRESWLNKLSVAPFDQEVLKHEFDDVAYPIKKIARLANDGVIIRLKRGLYCVSSEYSGKMIDPLVVANMLYGPSYISFESALAGYGLIPERVVETISAITSRSKSFSNPLGRFVYRTVPKEVFSIGVKSENGVIIASKEKALCDYLASRRNLRIFSSKALKEYLEEDVRFDFDAMGEVDCSIFAAYAASGYKQSLFTALERLFK